MEEQVTVGTPQEPFIDDQTTRQVARAIGLESNYELKKYQDQLKRLIDWAQVKGAKDSMDVIWTIKQLGNQMGSPKIGNNLAQHLSQYAFLDMERLKIEKEMASMGNDTSKIGIDKHD